MTTVKSMRAGEEIARNGAAMSGATFSKARVVFGGVSFSSSGMIADMMTKS